MTLRAATRQHSRESFRMSQQIALHWCPGQKDRERESKRERERERGSRERGGSREREKERVGSRE